MSFSFLNSFQNSNIAIRELLQKQSPDWDLNPEERTFNFHDSISENEGSPKKPVFTIVAGPNGAGKSTTSAEVVKEFGIKSFDWDKEFYSLWRQFSSDPAVMSGVSDRTNEIFNEAFEEAIALKKHFSFETNFQSIDVLEMVSKARRHGFDVYLYFITLSSADKAKLRVKKRVSEGGHDISDSTVEERFRLGLELLNSTYQEYDFVGLVESIDRKLIPIAFIDNQTGSSTKFNKALITIEGSINTLLEEVKSKGLA